MNYKYSRPKGFAQWQPQTDTLKIINQVTKTKKEKMK